jgi:hypothetical protein
MKKLIILIAFLLPVFLSGCFWELPMVPSTIESNQPPKAYIDSISPAGALVGELVSFTGHGTDTDGTVVAYRWKSSIDGELSTSDSFDTSELTEGEHIIYFRVQDNNDAWSEEVESSLTVTALVPPTPLAINDFSAMNEEIDLGDSTVLKWNVSGAEQVVIEPEIGEVDAIGSQAITPSETTIYTLTATSESSEETATLEIIVVEPEELVILYFEADPTAFPSGESSTLSWATTGATEVNIDQGIGEVDAEGSIEVSFGGEQTITYTLTASNETDTITASVDVQSYLIMLMPDSYEVTLSAIVNESGYVRSNGQVTQKYIYAGDDTNNIMLQGFFSFDISGLPEDAIINSVIFDMSDHDTFLGAPLEDLDCLRVYIDDYGTLDSSDYFTGTPLGAIARYCSISEIIAEENEYLEEALQDKVGESRLQLRLQFRYTPTDNDFSNDVARWTASHLPKITIQYYSYE